MQELTSSRSVLGTKKPQYHQEQNEASLLPRQKAMERGAGISQDSLSTPDVSGIVWTCYGKL